jgi:hypothetical protein
MIARLAAISRAVAPSPLPRCLPAAVTRIVTEYTTLLAEVTAMKNRAAIYGFS